MKNEFKPGSVKSWLYSTPCSDGNFENALNKATAAEIRDVLTVIEADLDNGAKVKSKYITLRRTLRKKERQK
ncbi:MAG: hypothetical protein LBP62_03265 [Clostridiales bacterium]|jgi:hypothetical protein|nr:hypothetical protein [Clostridiales bacterium]